MCDEPKSYHGGRGRGRRDEGRGLQIYLHIEAGSRATGLSVNAFCKAYPMAAMRIDFRGKRRVEPIKPATMRRAYARIKSRLRRSGDPAHIAAPTPHADALEQLVQRHMGILCEQK